MMFHLTYFVNNLFVKFCDLLGSIKAIASYDKALEIKISWQSHS